MKFKIVPSTHDGQHQALTTYVVNGTLAIDAGAIAVGLTHDEQRALRSIIITHVHLDHVFSLPIYLTELFDEIRTPVKIYATPSDFDALRETIFNPRVWIPLDTMSNAHGKLIEHVPFKAGERFTAEGLKVTPIPVTHTVLTHGLLLEDDRAALLFTSDTGATERIWQATRECDKLRAIFIDLSFSARLTALAQDSLHHSTVTIFDELPKMRPSVPVYAIHLKPTQRAEVVREIEARNQMAGAPVIHIAEIGREYAF